MTTIVSGDTTLSRIAVGAIGGAAGFFVGQTLQSQAQTTYASGTDIVQDASNWLKSTVGIGVDAAIGLVTGDWKWYLGSAGIGALVELVSGSMTGGTLFPLVLSVGSGLVTSFIYNATNTTGIYANGQTVAGAQDCADGNLRGCSVLDKNGNLVISASLANAVKNNWTYMLGGPLGSWYIGSKTGPLS